MIFAARGRNLEIKEHKKWKYSDNICVGCDKENESENELLSCPGLVKQGHHKTKLLYESLYSENTYEMFRVGTEIRKRLKCRKKILEEKEPD